MCLYKKSYIPRIALEDKVVYKVAYSSNGYYRTPKQHYPFKLSDVIKPALPFYKSLFHHTVSGEAVHAFQNKNNPLLVFYGIDMKKAVYIKCIIPRGSWYWLGYGGEIAASKIKTIEEISE